jgi:AraC-like DNA-binding protein/mannose-6-phosphate isomerase-like protein (cupin superfamily)
MKMGILNISEHQSCFHYDKTDHPQIQLVTFPKGFYEKRKAIDNEVIFFVTGKLKYSFRLFSDVPLGKGQVLFVPAGESYVFRTESSVLVLILRLHDHVQLCESYQIEKLFGLRDADDGQTFAPRTENMNILEMKSCLWRFLYSLLDCLKDGVRCHGFFELKIKEFLTLLRLYYPKEDIHDFFYLILSGDTAFSEYVRQWWPKFKNVKEMAESLHMSHKQFTDRFKSVFGTTPHKWINEARANMVLNALTTTSKSFKQIAIELGFSSDQQFSKFSRKSFGTTAKELRKTSKTPLDKDDDFLFSSFKRRKRSNSKV